MTTSAEPILQTRPQTLSPATGVHQNEITFAKIVLPIIAAFFAIAMIYKAVLGAPESPSALSFQAKLVEIVAALQFMFAFFIVSAVLRLLMKHKFKLDEAAIRADIMALMPHLKAMPIMLALGLVSFAAFIFAFVTFKVHIPHVHPFGLDQTFANLDARLFGGRQAWEYFRWIYALPFAIPAIDEVYRIWVMLVKTCWVYAFIACFDTLERRIKFMIAFAMTWIIGGVILATLLSSVGPIYYANIVDGPNPYAEQLALLGQINGLDSQYYQAILWEDYDRPGIGGLGISAMPSMHCAAAMLMALMFSTSRLMKLLSWSFFVTIFFGSFLLGWHYVSDSILGTAVALACWYSAGWITPRLIQKFGPQPG